MHQRPTVNLLHPEGGEFTVGRWCISHSSSKNKKARRISPPGLFCLSVLPSQRIRADLEFDFLALDALSTFDVPHEVGSVVRPDRAALPALEAGSGRSRVIVAGIQAASVEGQRRR